MSRRSGAESPPALSEPSGDPELVEGSAAEGSARPGEADHEALGMVAAIWSVRDRGGSPAAGKLRHAVFCPQPNCGQIAPCGFCPFDFAQGKNRPPGQLISQQKAHKEAITDGLTKLYNRRFFMNQLTQEMERSRRYQNPLSLLMIDIDNFKYYNDTNGHPAGDTALENVAQLFLKTVRKTDYVTRYGGEEFAILLPETPLENATLVGEKLRKTIEKFPFENEEAQPGGNLTISVGVAEQTKEMNSYEDFVIKADEALYKSKESGRNRVTLAGEN